MRGRTRGRRATREHGGRRTEDTDVTVRRVYRGGVYVRVSTMGRAKRRPFLLVPGIGVSSDYFERLAPNLLEYGPVIALDLPGFGGVPHGEHRLGIGDFADLVGAVIDELELDDPVVVGHSMGTQVVVDLVSRRPELSTLVLIGPVINAAERRVPIQAVRFFLSSLHEPGRVKLLAMGAYLLCGPRWFSRVLPAMMSYPIEDELGAIEAGTLVIRGEFDANCPRDWADRVADTLPRSAVWEIPGAAHSVMYAHAEQVSRLCVEHARDPADGRGDVDVQRLLSDGKPDEEPPADPRHLLRALAGRLTELRGVLFGDDTAISRGKTRHAEAMAESRAERSDQTGG